MLAPLSSQVIDAHRAKNIPIEHIGIDAVHPAMCDRCQNMIFGIRYKCNNCPDYDLCQDCVQHQSTCHDKTHKFLLKMRSAWPHEDLDSKMSTEKFFYQLNEQRRLNRLWRRT